MAEHVVNGIAATTAHTNDLDEVASYFIHCGFKSWHNHTFLLFLF
jgi:hypothetical protein